MYKHVAKTTIAIIISSQMFWQTCIGERMSRISGPRVCSEQWHAVDKGGTCSHVREEVGSSVRA